MKLRKAAENPNSQIKLELRGQTVSFDKQEVQAILDGAIMDAPRQGYGGPATTSKTPDFAWKPSAPLSWISSQFQGQRYDEPLKTAPYSFEEKQSQVAAFNKLRIGDYRPYTIRPNDVPETFRQLSDLEELRMVDPAAFAEKLKDPETKQAYEAYAQLRTQPLINGELGSGASKRTSAGRMIYWLVPEDRKVYARAYDLSYAKDSQPESAKGHQWYALPFEPELISKPEMTEINREIETAKGAVERMVSISEITRSARAVFQHAGDRTLYSQGDQNAPELVQFRQNLASYLAAFAERADQLYDRAETDQMKRDVGGAAGALASLRNVAWKETSYTVESKLFGLRTRVVQALEAKA